MNSTKFQKRAVGMVAVSVIALLVVATTWAERSELGTLSKSFERAVRKVFPNARIANVEHERHVVRLIEITVIDNGIEHELTLSQDGTILSIGREIAPDDLPTEVRKAVERIAGKTKIGEAERIKVLAELRVVSIKEPRIEYEAEFRTGNQLIVSEGGKTIKTKRNLRLEDEDD